jgi:hypothetical protein
MTIAKKWQFLDTNITAWVSIALLCIEMGEKQLKRITLKRLVDRVSGFVF